MCSTRAWLHKYCVTTDDYVVSFILSESPPLKHVQQDNINVQVPTVGP